jgi:hypothetical protein
MTDWLQWWRDHSRGALAGAYYDKNGERLVVIDRSLGDIERRLANIEVRLTAIEAKLARMTR